MAWESLSVAQFFGEPIELRLELLPAVATHLLLNREPALLHVVHLRREIAEVRCPVEPLLLLPVLSRSDNLIPHLRIGLQGEHEDLGRLADGVLNELEVPGVEGRQALRA